MSTLPPPLEALRWNDDGLLPAIVQDAETAEVLMLAWMDRESLARTLASGETHFYSRSRRKLWHKGATSGHTQQVVQLRVDCDSDVLLLTVRQTGGACHAGYRSCFFREWTQAGEWHTSAELVFNPEHVYR